MTCLGRIVRLSVTALVVLGLGNFGLSQSCDPNDPDNQCGTPSCDPTNPSVCDPADPYVFSPVTIMAGGYVPGLIAHPTQPGLMYARTDIGGVYRWTSATGRWVPLLDFNSPSNYNLTGPESIALDPNDPNKLYIAAGMYTSGPFAFLVSNDQGNTFSVYTETSFNMAANNDGRAAGERLAVNPFKPNELFMGTRSSGLWVSENSAQAWTKVTTFPVLTSSDGFGVHFVVFDPVNSGTIYAGAYTTSLVYVSKDDGATWTALPPVSWPFTVPTGTHAAAPERAVLNPDGNLYVTFGNLPGPNTMNYGIVEKYNTQTKAWTNVTPPYDGVFQTGPAGGFSGITQDPNHPGTVAVTTFDRWYPVDTVYITRDGGATWYDVGAITSANGVDGPPYGNYYFDSSVYNVSPYLTFGNTSYPISPYPTSKFGWWMSAVLIDPSNPDHLVYGTGATIYATNNVSSVYSGMAPTFYVQAQGIEETAVIAMASPTQGAHLLSGVGDIGGFRHDDFTVSPAGGMFTNPVATTVGSLAWAGQNPSVIARSQAPSSASTSPCTYGAYSSDGGTSWTPFPHCATGANSGNGGVVAVDAGGSMYMWGPATGSSNRPQYSTNNGSTWTSTTGLPSRVNSYADKVTPKLFYAYVSGSTGGFYSTTTSNGIAFTKVNTSPTSFTTGRCFGSGCGVIAANWAQTGDVWLPLGSNGLYHSTNGGVTWTKIGVAEVDSFAVGATVPGTSTQSVFIYGVVTTGGFRGIYRSDNSGTSWFQINDSAHQYGGPTLIAADPRVYGRVFLGMNGRGIIYIYPAASGVTLSAASLDFGHVTYETPSSTQTITLTSSGNVPLNINSVSASGDFSETDNCTSGPITMGGTCTINVTFLPTAAGPRTGTLTIADDAPGSPQSAGLSGTGDPASPVVTWTNPAAITYGTALDATQLNATAAFNGSPVPGMFAYTPAAGTVLPAGTQTLSMTFTPADTTDYTGASASVQITVTPAPLTITANNASKTLDAANPSFTATYSGFVLGQNASALTGTLSCATTATTTSQVGSYPITCSGQTSSNYAITHVNGTLTIVYAAAGVCDGDLGRTILQPISAGGGSVFKQRSTVPTKFRVCDANGVSIGNPGVVTSYRLTAIFAGTASTVDEPVSSTNADTAFRWDPSGQQWIFNTSTSNMMANDTYVFTITLNDGTSILFQYGLK